jgi:hypothetical protein
MGIFRVLFKFEPSGAENITLEVGQESS